MRHVRKGLVIPASPEALFSYADDHKRFSSHMSNPSWMMVGSTMSVSADERHGQAVGSHIILEGTLFGIPMYVDEVVTEYRPPYIKRWKTVTVRNLLVIGRYEMQFVIVPQGNYSKFQISIGYELPEKNRWLGVLLGDWYAHWCVRQLLDGAGKFFSKYRAPTLSS